MLRPEITAGSVAILQGPQLVLSPKTDGEARLLDRSPPPLFPRVRINQEAKHQGMNCHQSRGPAVDVGQEPSIRQSITGTWSPEPQRGRGITETACPCTGAFPGQLQEATCHSWSVLWQTCHRERPPTPNYIWRPPSPNPHPWIPLCSPALASGLEREEGSTLWGPAAQCCPCCGTGWLRCWCQLCQRDTPVCEVLSPATDVNTASRRGGRPGWRWPPRLCPHRCCTQRCCPDLRSHQHHCYCPWAPNSQVLRGCIGQGPLAHHPWLSASLEWSFSPEKSWISLSGQTSDPNQHRLWLTEAEPKSHNFNIWRKFRFLWDPSKEYFKIQRNEVFACLGREFTVQSEVIPSIIMI